MGMALYIQAIRKLPKKWISDDTQITIMGFDSVIAVNQNYPPMCYTIIHGWKTLEFKIDNGREGWQ